MISIEPEDIVNRFNKLKYPPTVWSHDWIYGLWYCSTAWKKAIYHGQFPATFVKRITTAFPPSQLDFLHLCCGRCHIEDAVNVDTMNLPEIDMQADGEALPFATNSFDVCLVDPPYSIQDADRYKNKRLINAKRSMQSIRQCLRPNGWLLWLDEKYPSYRRKDWKLRGLVGIVTGFERRVRVLSMWQNLKEYV